MDARLTIANMTTEWGALAGWFPCDLTTIAYMRQVRERLKAEGRSGSPMMTSNAGYVARCVRMLTPSMPDGSRST